MCTEAYGLQNKAVDDSFYRRSSITNAAGLNVDFFLFQLALFGVPCGLAPWVALFTLPGAAMFYF